MLHERFTERHVSDMYQFIYRYTGNREEAERLTARTFVAATRALMSTSAPTRQRAEELLGETARVVLTEELRARYRGLPEDAACVAALIHADSPSLSASGAGAATGALTYAQSVLARLPAPERDLLTYRFLLNSPLASVAQVMGLSAQGALTLQWAALAHAAQIVASDSQITPAACGRDA